MSELQSLALMQMWGSLPDGSAVPGAAARSPATPNLKRTRVAKHGGKRAQRLALQGKPAHVACVAHSSASQQAHRCLPANNSSKHGGLVAPRKLKQAGRQAGARLVREARQLGARQQLGGQLAQGVHRIHGHVRVCLCVGAGWDG